MATVGVELDYHHCTVCGQAQLVETPTWTDDTSADRGCVVCGTAVFIDPMLIWPARGPRARRDDHADTA